MRAGDDHDLAGDVIRRDWVDRRGDLAGPQHLSELDRERANTAGCTINENPIARRQKIHSRREHDDHRRVHCGVFGEAHSSVVAHLNQHLSGDTASSFELVLELILDGLQRLHKHD